MMDPLSGEVKSNDDRGNTRKVKLLLLMTLGTSLSIAMHVKHYFILPTIGFGGDKNVQTVANNNRKPFIDAITNGTSVYASFQSSSSSSSSSNATYDMKHKPATAMKQQPQKLTSTESLLPIYLLQPATNQTAQTTWGTLAKLWNRSTQYNNLLDMAAPIPSLPRANTNKALQSKLDFRPVIMIHCGPKTGSTTLRKACKFNLEKTCGVEPQKGSRNPLGYKEESKLYPLMRNCTNTSHFCAKEVSMPLLHEDVPIFDNVLFLHMFPFRNYDDWAASALKQIHDRGGGDECNRTRHMWEDRDCHNSHMEIDFRKYGKAALARFKEGVVQRMNGVDANRNKKKMEHHVFLLYHHRELHAVLEKLSDSYGIPGLPGSDGKGKVVRPDGTCDGALLEKFHDCFSWQLTELT